MCTSPGEIPIRLGQEPSMLFAPSTLASFEPWGEDLLFTCPGEASLSKPASSRATMW